MKKDDSLLFFEGLFIALFISVVFWAIIAYVAL